MQRYRIVMVVTVCTLGGALWMARGQVLGTRVVEAQTTVDRVDAVEVRRKSPVDENNRLRQITKHGEDLDLNASLAILQDVFGDELPPGAIDPLGVQRVEADEAAELVDTEHWVIVDVRKWPDLSGKGTIPGAIWAEYKFEGAEYDGVHLTGDRAHELLARHKGLIFVCNGPKCPRSFNACVAAVQVWRIDPTRVRWFYAGIGSWTRSPLVTLKDKPRVWPNDEM